MPHTIPLKLEENVFSQEKLKILLNKIETNSTEENLVFPGCGITDEQVEKIAEKLQTNTSVTSINLSNNCFGAVGYKALALVLQKRNDIKAIDVSGNLPIQDMALEKMNVLYRTRLDNNGHYKELSQQVVNMYKEIKIDPINGTISVIDPEEKRASLALEETNKPKITPPLKIVEIKHREKNETEVENLKSLLQSMSIDEAFPSTESTNHHVQNHLSERKNSFFSNKKEQKNNKQEKRKNYAHPEIDTTREKSHPNEIDEPEIGSRSNFPPKKEGVRKKLNREVVSFLNSKSNKKKEDELKKEERTLHRRATMYGQLIEKPEDLPTPQKGAK